MSISPVEAARIRASARKLHGTEEVQAAIARMAADAAAVVQDTDPVVLAVMHGGMFTAAELCRRFDFPYRFDYVHVGRYGDRLTGGELRWHVPPARSLAGRTVLAVDDILDRGETLRALHARLQDLGVAALHTAVLVSKRVPGAADRPWVDFVGLEIEDVYVFGCGMDYKGYWRGLPELYAVSERAEPELRPQSGERDRDRGRERDREQER